MCLISAMEPLDVVHNEEPVPEEHSTGEESIVDQGITQNDGVIALDDIVLSSDDTMQDQHASQDEKMESNDDAEQLITEREETSLRVDKETAEGVERDDEMVDNTEDVTQADGEPVMTEQADVEPREMRSENGDEGIGLDGEELDDNTKQDTGEELNQAEGAAAMEEGSYIPTQCQNAFLCIFQMCFVVTVVFLLFFLYKFVSFKGHKGTLQ